MSTSSDPSHATPSIVPSVVPFLVWIRTDEGADELYRLLTADTLDEVFKIITGVNVPMDRIVVTSSPLTLSLVVA